MRSLIDEHAFRRVYRQSVVDVMTRIGNDAHREIARHDRTLDPDRYDLRAYLAASEVRYQRVLRLFNRHAERGSAELSVFDVGGFLAAFPLTLARLGVKAALVEQYGLYHGALDRLYAFLVEEGMHVFDCDFSQPTERLGTFSLVTSLAVLEHLPDSPRVWINNLRINADRGLVIVDVPNIAYWPNRMRLLRGRSVHPNIAQVYDSETPFVGHHREYTAEELRSVLGWSGLDVETLRTFNYSVQWREFGTRGLLRWGWGLLPTLLPGCREILMAAARPNVRYGL